MEYEIGSTESISQAVTTSVAMCEDTDTTELPILYDAIDIDALENIFVDEGAIRVSFAYSDSRVEIHNGEYLTVESA